MRPRIIEELNGNRTILPEIINPKFHDARNCAVPPCGSCMLARAKKRLNNSNNVKTLAENKGALLHDKIDVGYFVLTDQYVCTTYGSSPAGYRRESRNRHFQGGTRYNDAASSLIWVENKVFLISNETVMGK